MVKYVYIRIPTDPSPHEWDTAYGSCRELFTLIRPSPRQGHQEQRQLSSEKDKRRAFPPKDVFRSDEKLFGRHGTTPRLGEVEGEYDEQAVQSGWSTWAAAYSKAHKPPTRRRIEPTRD